MNTERFSAKLLFQFRVDVPNAVRRLCEERIIVVNAKNATTALRLVLKYAKRSSYTYENSDGNMVAFEFVGIMDLLHLGIECGECEVWYDIKTRLRPMERKAQLIPNLDDLCAIREFKARYGARKRREGMGG